MSRGVYVIGTDTDVGKTVVCAGLMHVLLKAPCKAAYFKPVASGDTLVGGARVMIDTAFVRHASGFDENPCWVTPYAFNEALAPHLAARRAARHIDPAVIEESLRQLKQRYDWILAEGAGGLAVLLNDEGYMQYDLIRRLKFPCLVVARAGLGTINHTLLTLKVARDEGLEIKGLIISGATTNEIDQDNIETLRRYSGVDKLFVIPAMQGVKVETMETGDLQSVFEKAISADEICALMEPV